MYYIYHIPGIKVGCTKDLKSRTYQNKREYGHQITVELVATIPDKETAKWYEKDLAQYYGYPVGQLYGNQPDRKGKSLSQEHKSKISQGVKDTGRVYIELTTGITGTASELTEYFGYKNQSCFINQVNKNQPVLAGSRKGLHFQIYEEK